MAKKVKVSKINNDNEMLKLIKLVVIVSLIVCVFYVITLFVNKKEEEKEETKTPAVIQYDYILVGNILAQPNEDYYVLAKTSEDVNTKVYEAYLSNYKNTNKALRTYYIDLDNPLNSKFLNEESNFKIKDINEISFNQTTLLLIEDNKIKKAYEGKENILQKLKEITKVEETDKK